MSHDSSHDAAHDMSHDSSHYASHDVSHDSSHYASHDVSHDLPVVSLLETEDVSEVVRTSLTFLRVSATKPGCWSLGERETNVKPTLQSRGSGPLIYTCIYGSQKWSATGQLLARGGGGGGGGGGDMF